MPKPYMWPERQKSIFIKPKTSNIPPAPLVINASKTNKTLTIANIWHSASNSIRQRLVQSPQQIKCEMKALKKYEKSHKFDKIYFIKANKSIRLVEVLKV